MLSLLPDPAFKAIAAGLPWVLKAAALWLFVYGFYQFFWNDRFFWKKILHWSTWRGGNTTGLILTYLGLAFSWLADLSFRLTAPRDLDSVLFAALFMLASAALLSRMGWTVADRKHGEEGAP